IPNSVTRLRVNTSILALSLLRPPPRPPLFPYTTLFRSLIPPHAPVACGCDLHDRVERFRFAERPRAGHLVGVGTGEDLLDRHLQDRKSTRLNSSHVKISYAVFCLQKKSTTKRH